MIEKLTDALEKKAGFKKRRFYPVYPLKEGCYCRVAAGIDEPKPKILEHEKGWRLLEEPIDPLTDYGKKLVLYLTKGKGLLNTSYLKAFIVRNCGVAAPEGYTWKDILSALDEYTDGSGIQREAVLNYNPITASFFFSDDAAYFDDIPLKIPSKANRDILQLLIENFGCLVSFQEIEDKLETPGEENRKQALTALRKAIKDLPFEIPDSIKNAGAMIRLKE